MQDLIRDSITRFHSGLEEANGELMRSTIAIDDRKEEILRLLSSEIIIPQLPGGSGMYYEACREAISGVHKTLIAWQHSIRQIVERSEFVNRHEKSILVIAFADVKAGKSSLGNFVSGFYLQNTP